MRGLILRPVTMWVEAADLDRQFPNKHLSALYHTDIPTPRLLLAVNATELTHTKQTNKQNHTHKTK